MICWQRSLKDRIPDFYRCDAGGEQRIANVEMLMEKACAFEGTSYKGLFNFVRYIEQLKKYNVDYGEAGIMDEQAVYGTPDEYP